jgi:hypothetical protein
MNTRFISTTALILGLGVIAACSVPVTSTEATQPQRMEISYALRAGQTVRLAPDTTLKLERINDSRCRKNTVCVWEGYLSYSFTLQDAQGSKTFVLAENMPNAKPTATQNGIGFALEGLDPPEPLAADAPAPDYRVSLRVNIPRPT